MYNNSFFL